MAIGFLTLVLIQLGIFAAQRLFGNNGRRITPNSPERPGVEEGRPHPVIYGLQSIGPNLAYWGDAKVTTGISDSVQASHYYLRLIAWLGSGPIDRIYDLQFGGASLKLHPVTKGAVDWDLTTTTDTPLPITRDEAGSPTQVLVQALDLMGGREKEGGIAGPVRIHWGTSDQAVDALTTEVFGTDEATAWPTLAYLTLGAASGTAYSGFAEPISNLGKFYIGDNNPRMQELLVVCQRLPRGLLQLNLDADYTSSGLSFAEQLDAVAIGTNANPAEILYDLITNPVCAAGKSSDDLDLDSLVTLAKACRAEGIGLSLTLDGSQDVFDAVDEVLRHIRGVRYEDPETGKLAFRLIRGGDTAALTITKANARALKATFPTTGQQANEIRVSYSEYDAGTNGVITDEVLTTDLVFTYLGMAAAYQTAGRNISDVTVYADDEDVTDSCSINFESGVIYVFNTAAVTTGQTITVDYTASPTFLGYRPAVTAPQQDVADIERTGVVRTETVDAPWFTTALDAANYGAYLVSVRRASLGVVEFDVNREGSDLRPGDLVHVTWDFDSFTLTDYPVRLLKVHESALDDGWLHCAGVEDVFSNVAPPTLPGGGEPGSTSDAPTAPAIAIAVLDPSAFTIALFPSDTTFTIKLWVADSDLGQGITTGATVVSDAIPGTDTTVDYLNAGSPWADGTVKWFAAQLIRSGYNDGPLTPWVQGIAASGATPDPVCTVPALAVTPSDDGTTGTVALTLTDPQHRVMLVEFRHRSGTGAWSGWAADTSPYSDAVTLDADFDSEIQWRVTYQDCAGDTNAQLTGSWVFYADGFIPLSEKGVASGVATLDADGLVPTAQLPPLAIGHVQIVDDETARLALSATDIQSDDLVVQSDDGSAWMLVEEGDPAAAGDWVQIGGVGIGGVSSFNGRTGAVVPASGDYAVADVTGAAPLASPAFTGTPTAPTPSAADNSTKLATTAYVDAAVTAGGGSAPNVALDQATATGGENTMTLGSTPVTNSLQIFVNGLLLSPDEYTLTGTSVAFDTDLSADDLVVCRWLTTNALPGGIALSTFTSGPHRYWRINITAGSGGANNFPSIFELQFAQLGMAAHTGGTAIASSDDGSHPAGNAFDGDTGSFWAPSGAALPQWIGMDFGSDVTVDVVRVFPRGSNQFPSDFDVQSSDDGSSWTTEWSVSGLSFLPYLRPFPRPDLGKVLWRIKVSTGNTSNLWCASEIEYRLSSGGADQTSPTVPSACVSGDLFADALVNAFDDDNSSFASVSISNGGRLCYEFPSAKAVAEVAIRVRTSNGGQAPEDFTIESSPDGMTWTVERTVTGETAWGGTETRTFSVP